MRWPAEIIDLNGDLYARPSLFLSVVASYNRTKITMIGPSRLLDIRAHHGISKRRLGVISKGFLKDLMIGPTDRSIVACATMVKTE